MRRALTVTAAVLLLAGCAGADGKPSGIHPTTVQLPDGGQVECVYFDGHQKAGITCDWGAR